MRESAVGIRAVGSRVVGSRAAGSPAVGSRAVGSQILLCWNRILIISQHDSNIDKTLI